MASPLLGPLTEAHAVVGPGVTVVAAAGSDTTQGLMSLLQQQGYGTTATPFYNIPANYVLAGVGSVTVPGQNNSSCGDDTTWTADPLAPASNTAATEGVSPFGSTAGKKYLFAEDSGTGPNANTANGGTTASGTDYGCVNVARSSSAPGSLTGSSTDKAGFEYYAYALDAVSWASSSTRAPATLTQAQLLSIYNCNVTDWSQVGGAPGPIQRYFPQVGSGTRSFFATDILGQASNYAPPTGISGCPDAVLVEENEGQQVKATDTDSAIMPYSAAVWDLQQSNSINPSLDRRVNTVGALQILHGITTAATPAVTAVPVHWNGSNHDYELDSTTQVVESNVKVNLAAGATPVFPGIRYVYNILDSALTANNNYAAASSLFGFDNSSAGATAKSPMCSNTGASNNQQIAIGSIQSAGFASLNTTGNFNGSNVSGATCRLLKPTP
ncbi:MAG TPA: substrate-binding domain-containing protein [Acidimicrobiales bacterium]|nr:substrate-binding domain-containing protein [Acidimicrobiales bacterium]